MNKQSTPLNLLQRLSALPKKQALTISFGFGLAALLLHLLTYPFFLPATLLMLPATASISWSAGRRAGHLFALSSLALAMGYAGWFGPRPLPFSLDNGAFTLFVVAAAMPLFLEQLSISVGQADASREMGARLSRRLSEETVLTRVMALTTSRHDLSHVLDQVCAILAETYGVPRSGLALIDEARTRADVVAAYVAGSTTSSVGETIPLAGNPSMTRILGEKQVLAIDNAQVDPLMGPVNDLMRQLGVISILLIPIIVDDEVIGTIGCDAVTLRPFTPAEQALGQRVAHLIGQVIERKQTEAALQRERDFARRIMDSMGQGLIVADARRTITYCNPAFCRLAGSPAAEILGSKIDDLLLPDSAVDDAVLRHSWERQLSHTYDACLLQPDGTTLFTMVSVVPQLRSAGAATMIAVVSDVTARKELESAQRDARDRAVEASRLKSEFLANMSHEIRTPLNGVIGMTSLLLDTPLNDEQREYAATIHSSSEVLLALLNDILDFSKIEAGKMELEAQPFSLRACLEEALDVVAMRAAAKNLELAYRLADSAPAGIVGDVTRLRQVLINLLGNAVKFTAAGEIVVTARATPVNSTHQKISFAVRDTGIGIPVARQNRLFQSFSQVDASTTRRYGGTGLGLAISRHLVNLMGGEIGVESSVGEGTTFHFSIVVPIAPDPDDPLPGPQTRLPGRRALVVDDNGTSRDILSRLLAKWGLETTAVDSGQAALAALADGATFDVALLDRFMPGMDGLSLAAAIHARCGDALPLLLLNSLACPLSTSPDRPPLTQVPKPIKPRLLLNGLLKALGSGRPAPALRAPLTPPAAGGPLRILLAEDNRVNQRVALRLLARLGYEASCAANGAAALSAVADGAFDLVLMDVQMPTMDGITATRAIRELGDAIRQPCIIALTANALAGDRERYLEAGMDDYLAKPVRLSELADLLARYAPAHG